MAVNASFLTWNNSYFYILLFSFVGQVLAKIYRNKTNPVIVVPDWSTQYWCLQFLQGNSISNHPDHVTHTFQIFFKPFPVLGIIKTRQSWKFELVTSSSFQNIPFLRFHVCRERWRNRDIRKWRFLCIKWPRGKFICTRNPKITFRTSKN